MPTACAHVLLLTPSFPPCGGRSLRFLVGSGVLADKAGACLYNHDGTYSFTLAGRNVSVVADYTLKLYSGEHPLPATSLSLIPRLDFACCWHTHTV